MDEAKTQISNLNINTSRAASQMASQGKITQATNLASDEKRIVRESRYGGLETFNDHFEQSLR